MIETIRLLRDDQNRYRSVVDTGAASGLEYTQDRTTDAWEHLLSGTVAYHYARWKQNRFVSGIREQMRFRTWRIGRLLRSMAKKS